jgi:hypothetical protein
MGKAGQLIANTTPHDFLIFEIADENSNILNFVLIYQRVALFNTVKIRLFIWGIFLGIHQQAFPSGHLICRTVRCFINKKRTSKKQQAQR